MCSPEHGGMATHVHVVLASCRPAQTTARVGSRCALFSEQNFRWLKPLQLSYARWPRQFVNESVRNGSR